ncbi:MAG: peptidylprolyl isomerase [Aureliella sp.]
MITLTTNHGDIEIELLSEEAPKSSENFLTYAKEGFYEGTIFHRVIDGFMIQGGGFTAEMEQKKKNGPIENEGGNGVQNAKYTLAMARTADPNSATSQFFINVNDNRFLDRDQAQDGFGYAVFGRVVSGTEVVDKIAKVPTGTHRGMGDVPTEQVIIEKVAVAE